MEAILIERILWPYDDELKPVAHAAIFAYLTSRDLSIEDMKHNGWATSLCEGVVTYWYDGERICEIDERAGAVTVWGDKEAWQDYFGEGDELEELHSAD